MIYFTSNAAWWRGERDGNRVKETWDRKLTHEQQFPDEEAAQQHLDALIRRRRADGFDEHEIPDDADTGSITWNDGPKGPGGLLGGPGICHFEPSALQGLDSVKIGDRVLVKGFSKYAGPDATACTRTSSSAPW